MLQHDNIISIYQAFNSTEVSHKLITISPFRVKSLFTKIFFKTIISSFSSYSANLRKTLIWAVPYDRASGVIRCRIRVNTADVHQHSCIQNNMSSLSLSHHALCRDTTGIPPSNKWPWRNITQPRLSFLAFSSRPIQLTYQFSQGVFRIDGGPYLEKGVGSVLKGVTRKSKGVTLRKLARIAIMPKICALLQRIPYAKNY